VPKLKVVILAAGFSSRLGHSKALARVRGGSLLRRTAALAARISAAKIVVVLPCRAASYRIETQGLNVHLTANPQRAEGLSSSVQRGIARARYSSGVLFLPVDLPYLRHRDLARLVSRWRAARRSVIARKIGQDGETPRGGIPLILPRWLYARARSVRGDIGLRDLVGSLQPEQRVLLNLPSATLDIDTPRDLRAARRRARGSGLAV
jgi:molybdenum cofactor cytidylyltransferase